MRAELVGDSSTSCRSRSTLNVVRAFSYFSHLANLAEDVHQNRRRRAHALAGSPPQRGQPRRRAGRISRRRGVTPDALAEWLARSAGVARC